MPLLEEDPQDAPTAADVEIAPVSDRLARSVLFEDAQLTGLAVDFVRKENAILRDLVPVDESDFTGASEELSPQDATAQYGVEGYLTFDKPVERATAAFRNQYAQRRRFRDEVLAHSDISALEKIGTSLTGALTDPVAIPFYFAGGEAGLLRTLGVGARGGRLANIGRGALAGSVDGLVGGAVFEAGAYGLRRHAGEDDYDLGDSLLNLTAGALFGGTLGGLGGAFEPVGRALDVPDAVHPHDAPPPPRDVAALSRLERQGAMAQALDDMIEDRGVQLDDLLPRDRPPPGQGALDELAGEPSLPGRYLDDTVAVTTRGSEIRARYAIVELGDLVTSHDDDLFRNPDYPQALQPRSRERAGAQARNYQLEAELNPKRLMREAGAESGAPIVSPGGLVESGNGRTIALRRSAARGSPAYARYRAELEAQGFDLSGFERPALVRVRESGMSGEDRVRLTREMNADVTERMSATEQAFADAERIDQGVLDLLDGNDPGQAGSRTFVRAFLDRVAPDAANAFADASGRVARDGLDRVRAALMARAYGDKDLVAALFEAADTNIKTIGQALADAAPAWARMRAAAQAGDIPADLDLTDNLRSAVALVRHARDRGVPLDELIAQRLGQTEMFGGEAIAPETEALLRMMFRDEGFKRHRSADRIAQALADYAERAAATTPGPDLFGDLPDARAFLDNMLKRAQEPDANEPNLAAFDPDRWTSRQAGAPVVDLRPSGGDGGGPGGSGARPQGERAADVGRETGEPAAAVAEKPARAPKAPPAAADPELKALVEDTDALAAEAGVELAAPAPNREPANLAEAVRAAAVCMIGELG